MGLVLQRLSVIDNGLVAFTHVLRQDYAETGAIPSDTEDLISFTRSLAGVDVGLFFMAEQPAGEHPRSVFRSREQDRRGPDRGKFRRRRPSFGVRGRGGRVSC